MMADPEMWDCIVVGAGIIGLWTAYHLTLRQQKVLILEQFQIPHTRGSSSGHSRILKCSDRNDHLAEMMSECYTWWHHLEEKCGKILYRETGMLFIEGPNNAGDIHKCQAAMDKYSLPYSLLSADDLRQRYPMLQYPSDHRALLDHRAGFLQPCRCLAALQKQIELRGGKVLDNVKVQRILSGSVTTVVTATGIHNARNVVLATGPWAKDFLQTLGLDLPLKTMPGCSVFLKDTTGPPGQYTIENGFPLGHHYIHHASDKYRFVDFFPSMEYPNLIKMGTRGEPTETYCHPDKRDCRSNDAFVEVVLPYVQRHLPGLEMKVSLLEPCMYTMTPDRQFIIDRHPDLRNVFIAAGFSGHGFARSPVVGKLLTELVLRETPSYTLEPYRIDRFRFSKL